MDRRFLVAAAVLVLGCHGCCQDSVWGCFCWAARPLGRGLWFSDPLDMSSESQPPLVAAINFSVSGRFGGSGLSRPPFQAVRSFMGRLDEVGQVLLANFDCKKVGRRLRAPQDSSSPARGLFCSPARGPFGYMHENASETKGTLLTVAFQPGLNSMLSSTSKRTCGR